MTAPTHTDARDEARRWPAWFAPLGFVVALTAALILAAMGAAVSAAVTGDASGRPPGLVITSTLLQDLAFVGTAFFLARLVSRPRAADLGLRPARVRRAVAWTLGAGAAFYAFLAAYSALLRPDGEQDVLDALGADDGMVLLVLSGLIVVVAAPFAEEILFRGFMYRSLRNRFGPLVSTLTIGVIFGSIHYSGPETLELLLPLAVLGAVFCVLYERTGSLYPPIALHAVNNAIAFAATAGAAGAGIVAAGALVLSLGLCLGLSARPMLRPAS